MIGRGEREGCGYSEEHHMQLLSANRHGGHEQLRLPQDRRSHPVHLSQGPTVYNLVGEGEYALPHTSHRWWEEGNHGNDPETFRVCAPLPDGFWKTESVHDLPQEHTSAPPVMDLELVDRLPDHERIVQYLGSQWGHAAMTVEV